MQTLHAMRKQMPLVLPWPKLAPGSFFAHAKFSKINCQFSNEEKEGHLEN